MQLQALRNYKRPDLQVFLRICHQLWNHFQKKLSEEELKRHLLQYFQLLDDFEYQEKLVQYFLEQGQKEMWVEKNFFLSIEPYVQLAKLHIQRILFKKQSEHLAFLLTQKDFFALHKMFVLDIQREAHSRSHLLNQVLQIERNPIEFDALHQELNYFWEEGTLLDFVEKEKKALKEAEKKQYALSEFVKIFFLRKAFLQQLPSFLKKFEKEFPFFSLADKYACHSPRHLALEHLGQSMAFYEKNYSEEEVHALSAWILKIFPSYFEALLKRSKKMAPEAAEKFVEEDIEKIFSLLSVPRAELDSEEETKLFQKMTFEAFSLKNLLIEKELYKEKFEEEKTFFERVRALGKGESNFSSAFFDFSMRAQGLIVKDRESSKKFSLLLKAYYHLQQRNSVLYPYFSPLKELSLLSVSRLLFFSLLKEENQEAKSEEFTELEKAEYAFFLEFIFTLLQDAFFYQLQEFLYEKENLNEASYRSYVKSFFEKHFPFLSFSEKMLEILGFWPHQHKAFYHHPLFFEEQMLAKVSALGIWSLFQQKKEKETLFLLSELYKETEEDFFYQLAQRKFPSPFDPLLQKRLSFQLAFYLHF